MQIARIADLAITTSTTRPGTPFDAPATGDDAMTITPATAARLAKVRECIAGAADELYGIDRDTLDEPGWIALIGAANDIRVAERALARMLGERPNREAAALEG